MDQSIVKPVKIQLFSEEGRKYLREIVSLVDLRNSCARFDSSNIPTETSKTIDDQSQTFRFGCTVCNFQCNSVPEQREHFQSEWHLFNLRRRLKSKSIFNQEIYEDILKGSKDVEKSDSSSSDSSSSEEDVDEDDVKPMESNSSSKFDLSTAAGTRGGSVFFVTSSNSIVACYRALLTSVRSYQVENQALLSSVRQLCASKSNIWIVIILSGGHFAAAVFDNGQTTPNTTDEAIVHKTVHRYTVRAKQGGAQSVKDAQNGKAKSAGANLRRFNEEALVKDINNILNSWNEHVRRASAIFLRCAIYKRQIFFGGDQPLLSKNDPRVRNIPFVTNRPTYEETKRVRRELATLDVYESYDTFARLYRTESTEKSTADLEKEVERMAELELEKRKKKRAKRKTTEDDGGSDGKTADKSIASDPSKKSSKQTEGESSKKVQEFKLSQDIRQQLYTACKRGDSTAMWRIVESYPHDQQADILEYLQSPVNDRDSSTFLHLASSSGHTDLVRFLLEIGCDPRLRNARGQVPVQVADSRPTRNVFSEFRREHPLRWDWNAAQIPEPIDPELEASRKAKQAEKKKVQQKARAERMKEQKELDAKARAEEEEKHRYLRLSDREKRALAAEKRLLAASVEKKEESPASLVLSRCFRCGVDITGKVPFEYSDNRFCSTKCVKEHRSTLERQ